MSGPLTQSDDIVLQEGEGAMINNMPRIYLIAVNKRLVERAFPHMGFHPHDSIPYFQGPMSPQSQSATYIVRLELPPGSPDVIPFATIWDPITLPRHDGGSINELGLTGAYHASSSGPGGRIRICHTPHDQWDASRTYVQVLVKVQLWIDAYHVHLAAGKTIHEVFA